MQPCCLDGWLVWGDAPSRNGHNEGPKGIKYGRSDNVFAKSSRLAVTCY